jgi:hypothetical protein
MSKRVRDWYGTNPESFFDVYTWVTTKMVICQVYTWYIPCIYLLNVYDRDIPGKLGLPGQSERNTQCLRTVGCKKSDLQGINTGSEC